MKRIALIDFSHALRVQYHVKTPDGTPTQAGEHTLQQLSDWRRAFDHIVVCLDSPPYTRKQILPTYKSSRERDDGYMLVCKWAKDRLIKDGYSIAAHPGAEADDVAATLAKRLWDRGMSAFLVGGDKDMAQCVLDSEQHVVHIMAPTGGGKWEERDTEWVKTKYGVGPSDMALLQAIMGDGTDDIPGVKGIGAKGAAKLITEYGTIIRMRVAATKALEDSQQPGAKPLPAFWAKFLAGSPDLPKWLELTTLRTDLPLDVDALLVRQPVLPLVVTPEDIEHGDAWEPSAEELEEERAMLDPEVVISGPKASAVPSPPVTPSAAQPSTTARPTSVAKPSVPSPEARTPSIAATADAASAPNGHASENVSIVVDRPAPPSWALALQPSTAVEALRIAAVLFNSRVCSQFGSERGVYAVISLGRELGLGMMASLQGFHIVSDKPFASSNLLRALAEKDTNCEWLICTHADDQSATWVTKHRKIPEPMSYTYTRERAEQAGMFTGKNSHNWKTKTTEMLEKTAAAKGVRRWYPATTMGLHCPEEMTDD